MATTSDEAARIAAIGPDRRRHAAILRRAALTVVIGIAFVTGFAITGQEGAARAVANAGSDLTLLLRAMALLKAMMVVAFAGALAWRLAAPVPPSRLLAYLASAATMAAGIGLIWEIVHVAAGATMLHAGLIAGVVLLWRDPAVARRLADSLAGRIGSDR